MVSMCSSKGNVVPLLVPCPPPRRFLEASHMSLNSSDSGEILDSIELKLRSVGAIAANQKTTAVISSSRRNQATSSVICYEKEYCNLQPSASYLDFQEAFPAFGTTLTMLKWTK